MAASLEHVTPLRDGGTWELSNLRLAHKRCNNEDVKRKQLAAALLSFA